MGQVYRARDTRLNRDVALKVLPDSFANDPERLARFTREAQMLAALNHPNIAHIHGLEEAGGIRAIVMELVDGDDLSDVIARGVAATRGLSGGSRALSIDDALNIARQICAALEAAHDLGIVHRDLKPANIKVRPDGTVKVLDFGLAKALAPDGAAVSASVMNSPTITSPAMTAMGVILGTAAYMSPEQARGKVADRRSDIWSFGAVLFEMVTGRRAFLGEDLTDTLAAVVKLDPDWRAVDADVPPRIRQALRMCLQKNPTERAQAIGDVRLLLAGAFEPDAPAKTVVTAPVSRTRELIAWTALAIVSLAAAVLAYAAFTRRPEAARAVRFAVPPPDGSSLAVALSASGASPAPLAISPDGTRIAFVATSSSGSAHLWVRALDALGAVELAGTDGAMSPFWSPDSKSIAFFSGGKLKKISVAGGPAIALCDASDNVGGAWNKDDVIVFSPGTASALVKVPASGGVPSPATVLAAGESFHARPAFLPDGRHFLYRVGNGGLFVGDLGSTARTLVAKSVNSTNVLYSQGHLLFLRDQTLMAQRFDLDRFTLAGEPVPIAEQVLTLAQNPYAVMSVSDTGVLVYQTGTSASADRELAWFDRTGTKIGTAGTRAVYNTLSLSPDGTRAAVSLASVQTPTGASGLATNIDLWIQEFARGTSTRFTVDPMLDWMGVWSPDSSHLAWSSSRNGVSDLFQKPSNGTGTDELVLKSDTASRYVYDWSPDGRVLLYGQVNSSLYSLWTVPVAGDRVATRYLEIPGFNAAQGQFSPDGRYVAFSSNFSGGTEVYVKPYPNAAGGQWLISQGGGGQPRWRRDGKELFYISADSRVMAVPISTTPAFTPGVAVPLFGISMSAGNATLVNITRYGVTADGSRFLINILPADAKVATLPPMTVVLNWTAALPQGR